VGRPKKRPEKPVQTETIVSKPLRCSKTIVGLLLANQAMQTEVTKPKIRPKLKAEAKVNNAFFKVMAKILGETRIKNYGQKVYVLQILHIKQT
jgi:hypothetical protein